MSKQQKQIVIVLGAAVALYLLYRWYTGNQAAAAGQAAGQTAADGTQYAALAGQEQSDVANLQHQLDQQAQAQALANQGFAKYIAGLLKAIKRDQAINRRDAARIKRLANAERKLRKEVQKLRHENHIGQTGGNHSVAHPNKGHRPHTGYNPTTSPASWQQQAKSDHPAARKTRPTPHPSAGKRDTASHVGGHAQTQARKPATHGTKTSGRRR